MINRRMSVTGLTDDDLTQMTAWLLLRTAGMSSVADFFSLTSTEIKFIMAEQDIAEINSVTVNRGKYFSLSGALNQVSWLQITFNVPGNAKSTIFFPVKR